MPPADPASLVYSTAKEVKKRGGISRLVIQLLYTYRIGDASIVISSLSTSRGRKGMVLVFGMSSKDLLSKRILPVRLRLKTKNTNK
jgi:hypothetical protein